MAAQTLVQVSLVLRLTLGLIFMISALTKLRDVSAFVQGVLEYGVLPRPLARLYGRLLPFAELGTALLLLSGVGLVVAISLAVLLLASFSIATVAVTVQGRDIDCHCFGSARRHSRVGWHTLGRDVALLLLALRLLETVATGRRGVRPWFQYDPGFVALAFVLAAGLAFTYVLVAEGLDVLVRLAGQRGAEG
jgi:uncharacterized membrane protein YphA (DoxX/SURF4 family)